MSIVVEPHGRLRWRIRSTYFSPKLRYAGRHTPGLKFWEGEEDGVHTRAWVGLADAVDACARRLREMGLRVQGDVPEPGGDELTLTLPIATSGLFDYQIEGVEFLVAYAREGAILADQMGLGKTAQASRAARAFRTKTLVICPAMVKQTWRDEMAKWWPTARVAEVKGGAKVASEKAWNEIARDADVVVIHYDVVAAWADFIVGWAKLLILDEAHYLVSDKARRSRAIRQIADWCPYRFALTGTPMVSRPRDMWNLLDTLYGGRFGKFFSFAINYCDAHQFEVESKKGGAASTKVFWSFDGASNLPELKRRMKFVMLRRTKKQVAHELPPMTRQYLHVEVPRAKIIAPHLAFKSESALKHALTMAADGKLPQVVALVCDHARAGDHKVIVWCWRRKIAEFIAQEVHREMQKLGKSTTVGVVHGGQTHSERRRRIDKEPDVLCATMDSIGVGVNLISYDTQVFAELSWLPSTLAQSEARPHRHGQKRKVLTQYVIARSTCDEWIKQGIIEKLDTAEQAIGESGDGMLEDLEASNARTRERGLRDLYDRVVEKMKEDAA